MKKIMRVGVIALMALTLVACSNIKSGKIHDKSYHAGYYSSSTSCVSHNSKGACTGYTSHQNYNPPSYRFDLYQSKDKHGWHRVDAITYSKYKVGDYYNDEGK